MRALALIVLIAAGSLRPVADQSSDLTGYYPVSSGVYFQSIGDPTACWTFDDAVAGTLASDCAGSYTFTVVDIPTLIADYTYPDDSQGGAWDFDGTDDYLSIANGSGGADFIPSGDATWQLIVTPDDVGGNGDIAANWNNAAAQQSWLISHVGDDVYYTISKDGTTDPGSYSQVIMTDVLESGQAAVITATYDYVADGTSVLCLGVDGNWQSTSSAVGPVHAGTADFTMAERHGGIGNQFDGSIHHFAYIDGSVATEAEHNEFMASWQGRIGATRRQLDVISTTPPSILISAGQDSGMVRPAPNSTVVGTYGVCGGDAATSLIHRGPLEDMDGSNHPTGWTTAENNGTVDGDTTTFFEGKRSVKIVGSNPSCLTYIQSNCVTASPSTDYWVSVWAKKETGTSALWINVVTYTDGSCSVGAAGHAVYNDDVTTSWAEYDGVITTGAGDNSMWIRIYNNQTVSTLYVDAVVVTQSSTPDTPCLCDATAQCACTTADITDSYVPITTGDWCLEIVGSSWIDGASSVTRTLLTVPATAGNNNKVTATLASDLLTLDVYDSTGTKHSATVACATSVYTDATIRLNHSHAGIIWACCDGTCGDIASGATMDSVGSEFIIAGDGTNGGNWCIKSLVPKSRTCSR